MPPTPCLSLTVDHRQSGFVQKPEAPVLEQPDGQDGEGEEHDEDEQVRAVLPVALLSLLLCYDVLHGAVLRRRGCSANADAHRQADQHQQPQRPRRPPRPAGSHSEHHVGGSRAAMSSRVTANFVQILPTNCPGSR